MFPIRRSRTAQRRGRTVLGIGTVAAHLLISAAAQAEGTAQLGAGQDIRETTAIEVDILSVGEIINDIRIIIVRQCDVTHGKQGSIDDRSVGTTVASFTIHASYDGLAMHREVIRGIAAARPKLGQVRLAGTAQRKA